MGNFLTSPREQASTSLFDMLQGGRTPFDSEITKSVNIGRSGVRSGTEGAIARSGADTVSRLASEGVSGGAGVEDLIGRESSRIRESGQRAEGDIVAQGLNTKAQIGASLYPTALNGLSPTSDLGNWLAGLETITGIGTGVLTGLGPGGLGILGKPLFEGLLGSSSSSKKPPVTSERDRYGVPKFGRPNEPSLYYGGGK